MQNKNNNHPITDAHISPFIWLQGENKRILTILLAILTNSQRGLAIFDGFQARIISTVFSHLTKLNAYSTLQMDQIINGREIK